MLFDYSSTATIEKAVMEMDRCFLPSNVIDQELGQPVGNEDTRKGRYS